MKQRGSIGYAAIGWDIDKVIVVMSKIVRRLFLFKHTEYLVQIEYKGNVLPSYYWVHEDCIEWEE